MPDLCPHCQKEVALDAYRICPACNHYFPLTIAQRLELIVDAGSFVEMSAEMRSRNPISLAGY